MIKKNTLKMNQKRIPFFAFIMLIIITTSCYVSKRLPVATGYSAKYLCSSYFVSHRSKDSVENEDLNFSIIKYAHNKINEQEKSVTSKILGMAKAKAIYIDGRGCILVKGKTEEEIRKMEDEIVYLEGFIQSVMKKLSNERFVQNAKPEIVEIERKKLSDAESKIASLKESIAGMR